MIQKIEKLLDLAAEALSLYIEDARQSRGETLPLKEAAPAEKKAGRPRKEKAAAPEPESPFGAIPQPSTPAQAPVKASIEDQTEAKRRSQEVMGLFIRRFLKSQPPGLDRAKGILAEVCGRSIAKLEDLTYDDHTKLIPRFERELEQADAK